MYNLFVTYQDDAWAQPFHEFDTARFTEYTSNALRERFRKLDQQAIDDLLSFPCLFAYEQVHNLPARVGWITRIRTRDRSVRVEFELQEELPAIPAARIEELSWDLDIGQLEMNRTHWAIKDVDLFPVLIEAGVLTNQQAHRGRAGALAAPAAHHPVDVQPSILRFPDAPQEQDLVSVMMPFAGAFDEIYDALRRACTSAGLRCHRADDLWNEDVVIDEVASLIYRSKFVICDFTGKNTNVFYEAGIAHTLGRMVIPIAQSADDVPFDLRHRRYLSYESTVPGLVLLREKIGARLRTLHARR